MSKHSPINSNWDVENLTRRMKRTERLMAPHMNRLESPEGQFAFMLISGVSAAIGDGKENEEALAPVVKLASEMTGIPLDAMTAHAECTLALMRAAAQHQQTSMDGDDA